jgi:putative transposase
MWFSGERPNRSIPYNRAFIIQTSLPISRGQAEVDPRKGIRYDYRYFWHDSMDEFDVANELVFFRYDPFDASLGYAFIRKNWEICRTKDFPVFQGRSEREIALATAELRARNKLANKSKKAKDISDYELAAFLESTQAEEVLLIQRMKDREAAPIRQKYSNPDDSQENLHFIPVVEEIFDDAAEQVASTEAEAKREIQPIQEDADDDDELLGEF